ncbi:MAG: hypothetical protein JNN15_17580 [Blastocatellia bacterium]|nr:hypothetical protein [Blastocatellia bacterium]
MNGSLATEREEEKPIVYYPSESTPDIVEAHLRADPNLKPETAKALSELFRVAYFQFAGSSIEVVETETKKQKK